MWNPFSRKPPPRGTTSRHRTPPTPPSNAPFAADSIATVDRLGPTAIATLTVTALTTTEGVGLLTNLFSEITHSGARSLVLDLQNLEYMDSVCLGFLISALNGAIATGGRIALVNCDGHVLELFRLLSFDRRFPIYADVPSALARLEQC